LGNGEIEKSLILFVIPSADREIFLHVKCFGGIVIEALRKSSVKLIDFDRGAR